MPITKPQTEKGSELLFSVVYSPLLFLPSRIRWLYILFLWSPCSRLVASGDDTNIYIYINLSVSVCLPLSVTLPPSPFHLPSSDLKQQVPLNRLNEKACAYRMSVILSLCGPTVPRLRCHHTHIRIYIQAHIHLGAVWAKKEWGFFFLVSACALVCVLHTANK